MDRRVPSVVISGYYGYGNVGDEAVLGGIVTSLKQLIPNIRITVLTANPKFSNRLHPGVFTARRYNPRDLVKSLRAADVLISGGGSLLQDATSARSSYYYLAVLHLARYLGCKRVIYAQGVGPLNRGSVRKGVSSELSRADIITVRDAESRKLLSDIGIDKNRIEIVADPAFLVDADYESADAMLREHGLLGKPVLGVCLRPWPGLEKVLPIIRDGILEFCRTNGASAIAIPMQGSDDTAIAQQLNIGPVLRSNGDFRTVKGIVSRCQGVMAMRLHALIFAASEGVPFLPLIYDPKVSSFARLISNAEGIPVDSVELKRIVESLTGMWCSDILRKAQFDDIRIKMRESAMIPAYKLVELLGSTRFKEQL